MDGKKKRAYSDAGSASVAVGLGACLVGSVVKVAGYGGVGIVGRGACFGMPAGPVGMAIGAMAGLSLVGLAIVVRSVYEAHCSDDSPVTDPNSL